MDMADGNMTTENELPEDTYHDEGRTQIAQRHSYAHYGKPGWNWLTTEYFDREGKRTKITQHHPNGNLFKVVEFESNGAVPIITLMNMDYPSKKLANLIIENGETKRLEMFDADGRKILQSFVFQGKEFSVYDHLNHDNTRHHLDFDKEFARHCDGVYQSRLMYLLMPISDIAPSSGFPLRFLELYPNGYVKKNRLIHDGFSLTYSMKPHAAGVFKCETINQEGNAEIALSDPLHEKLPVGYLTLDKYKRPHSYIQSVKAFEGINPWNFKGMEATLFFDYEKDIFRIVINKQGIAGEIGEEVVAFEGLPMERLQSPILCKDVPGFEDKGDTVFLDLPACMRLIDIMQHDYPYEWASQPAKEAPSENKASTANPDAPAPLSEADALPPVRQPQPDGPYKGAPMRIFTARRGDEIIPLGEERDRPDGSRYSKLELEPDGSGTKTFYYKTPGEPKQRSVIEFAGAELDNRLVIESIEDEGVARRQLQLLEALAAKAGNRIILDFSQHPPGISEQDSNFIVAAHELATKQGKRIELAGLTGRGDPEQAAIGRALDSVNGRAGKKIKRLAPEDSVCLAIHDIHKVPKSRTDFTEDGVVCYHEKFADSGDLKGMFEDESEKNPVKVRRPLDDERPEKPKEFTKEIAVASEKGERLRKIFYSQAKDTKPVELGYEEFRADNSLYSKAEWDEKGGGTLTIFYPPAGDLMKQDKLAPEVKRTVFTFSAANFADVNNKILLKRGADYELAKVEAAEMADKQNVREVVLDFGAFSSISEAECQLIRDVQGILGPVKKSLKLAGLDGRSDMNERRAIDLGLAKVMPFMIANHIKKLEPGFTTIPAIHALGKVLAKREDFKPGDQDHPNYIEKYDPQTGALIGKPQEPKSATSMRDATKRQFEDDPVVQSRGRF